MPTPKTLKDYFSERLSKGNVPGGWLVVLKRGEVVHRQIFGYRDVENQRKMSETTYIHLGSVGKMFTGACIAQLVLENKLDLNGSIIDFFPGALDSWRRVRVLDLVGQTSGLPDYYARRRLHIDHEYSTSELLARLFPLAPVFQPGTAWQYSNTNYLLLGLIIERVTNARYGYYLRERLLHPIGVNSIFAEGYAPERVILSNGYSDDNDPVVSTTMSQTADGCLWGSMNGLIQWDVALDQISDSMKEMLWTPFTLPDGTSTGYGYGWSIESRQGHTVYWHNGYWQGFSTFYARYPKKKVSIALCLNGGKTNADRLGFAVADRVVGRKVPAVVAGT